LAKRSRLLNPKTKTPRNRYCFCNACFYLPKISDLLQNTQDFDNAGDSAWLNNLNMTAASVFRDIAIIGSLAVQKDLHIGGIVYAATLNVDTVNAKKLCLDDVCITKDELKRLLELSNRQSAEVNPAIQAESSAFSSPNPNTDATSMLDSSFGTASPEADSNTSIGTPALLPANSETASSTPSN
jgi:hypothetical protein